MDARLMPASLLALTSAVIWAAAFFWNNRRERLDANRLAEFKTKGPNWFGEAGLANDLQRDRLTVFAIVSLVGAIPMTIALVLLLKR